MLHIAIAQRNHALVDYLLSYDVTIDNKARGIFFQPKHGDLRDVHVGTYYGSTPLCFAASIGDAELMDTLTVYCRKLVLQGLESGWRPPVAGCVCMYVCMYVCVCVCMYTCICVYDNTYTHKHTHRPEYVVMYTCVDSYICMRV